jgi:uncharacterized repeat protein (TIGR04138 family)
MLDPAISRLLEEDRRYPLAAYIFLYEALHFAQNVLGLGNEVPSEPLPPGTLETEEDEEAASQRHVTGQELCEAIRQFALDQFGYMAKTVLNRWGICSTGDFGNMVFNLIRVGRMRKTPADRREDFDNVYQFDTAFQQQFRIMIPEEKA